MIEKLIQRGQETDSCSYSSNWLWLWKIPKKIPKRAERKVVFCKVSFSFSKSKCPRVLSKDVICNINVIYLLSLDCYVRYFWIKQPLLNFSSSRFGCSYFDWETCSVKNTEIHLSGKIQISSFIGIRLVRLVRFSQ